MSEFQKIREAADYADTLIHKFNLVVTIQTTPGRLDVDWTARYHHMDDLRIEDTKDGWTHVRFVPNGVIEINVDKFLRRSRDVNFHTVRHEIAHAIVHQRRMEDGFSHGPAWMRVARMLRVSVGAYEPGGHIYEGYREALALLHPRAKARWESGGFRPPHLAYDETSSRPEP